MVNEKAKEFLLETIARDEGYQSHAGMMDLIRKLKNLRGCGFKKECMSFPELKKVARETSYESIMMLFRGNNLSYESFQLGGVAPDADNSRDGCMVRAEEIRKALLFAYLTAQTIPKNKKRGCQ